MMMVVKYHKAGAELILSKIEKVSQGSPLDVQDINDVMSDAVVDVWICAYEPWIPSARAEFEKIMKSLQTDSPSNLSKWGTNIDTGIRTALENPRRLRAALAMMSAFSWPKAEWAAHKYLPKDTPINVDIFATIDGFNGGMYRGDKVFISILHVNHTVMRASNFSHEFHHVGMEYWWKQHTLVQKYNETKDTKEYWMLRIIEYLVSEGLANAFCSPGVFEKREGDSDGIAAHNAIIDEYEDRWDEFHSMLESIIDAITKNELEVLKEKYETFTLDMSGRGKPIGHFFSGRIIREMDRSKNVAREQIIGLVKEPFSFFELYNKAAKERGLPRFSLDSITSLDSLIEKMRG
jgi:hypothetical protein